MESSLSKKVKQLTQSKLKTISEEEVYKSNELIRYLENLSISMLDKGMRRLHIVIAEFFQNGQAAFTNGDNVYVSWKNEFIDYFETPEQRFSAFCGLFFHEVAHVLFLDFDEEKKAAEIIDSGAFCGYEMTDLDPDETVSWKEMQAAIKDPTTRPIFVSVFHELTNILCDVHDENSLINVYGHIVGEGLYAVRIAQRNTLPLFEDSYASVSSGKGTDLMLAYDLLLQTAYFRSVHCHDQAEVDASRFAPMLESVNRHVRIACATNDVFRRFTEQNYIMIALWPFIREELQRQQQNSQNQGNAGQKQANAGGSPNAAPNNSPTKEQVQNILNQLSQASSNGSKRNLPEQRQSSQTAAASRADERSGKTTASSAETATQTSPMSGRDTGQVENNILNTVKSQIADEKAKKEIEKNQANELVEGIRKIPQTSTHQGVPLDVTRVLDVQTKDIAAYESMMRDLKPISLRLQRQVIAALKDQREGYLQRHRLFGKELVAGDTYRPDGRCYASKKLPRDLPNMAISILVDHSGSMYSRIDSAMLASILLYDFATGCGIPVSVSGHNTDCGHVNYITYADFDDVSGNDKYRLAKMPQYINDRNRDGMALNIAANLLSKRPEEVKLLIIVNDGMPNHNGYSGETAKKDLQNIIRMQKRKGVDIIAAALGSDRKQIQEIYRDDFLDISRLEEMPKKFVSIVKSRILRDAE